MLSSADECNGVTSDLKPLYRIVRKEMNERRYFCPNEGCEHHMVAFLVKAFQRLISIQKESEKSTDEELKESERAATQIDLELIESAGLEYPQAMKHVEFSCSLAMAECRLGCGLKMKRLDLESHE